MLNEISPAVIRPGPRERQQHAPARAPVRRAMHQQRPLRAKRGIFWITPNRSITSQRQRVLHEADRYAMRHCGAIVTSHQPPSDSARSATEISVRYCRAASSGRAPSPRPTYERRDQQQHDQPAHAARADAREEIGGGKASSRPKRPSRGRRARACGRTRRDRSCRSGCPVIFERHSCRLRRPEQRLGSRLWRTKKNCGTRNSSADTANAARSADRTLTVVCIMRRATESTGVSPGERSRPASRRDRYLRALSGSLHDDLVSVRIVHKAEIDTTAKEAAAAHRHRRARSPGLRSPGRRRAASRGEPCKSLAALPSLRSGRVPDPLAARHPYGDTVAFAALSGSGKQVRAPDEIRNEQRLRIAVKILRLADLFDQPAIHHHDAIRERHRLLLVVRHKNCRGGEGRWMRVNSRCISSRSFWSSAPSGSSINSTRGS